MAQFPGTLSIIGTTSFLNGTLLVNGGDPSGATAILQAQGCSSNHFAIVTGRAVTIGTTPAIEMSGAQCTGLETTVRELRAAMRKAAKKAPGRKASNKKGGK